jgi:hypothetical protein
MKKSFDRRQSTRIGTCSDLVLPTKEKKTANMFFAYGALEAGSLLAKKTKENVQVGTVGGNGIVRKPSLHRQVLEEKLQVFADVREQQGKNPGEKKSPNGLRRGFTFRTGFASG